METPRPIVSLSQMREVLKYAANLKGSNGLSRVVAVYFFVDPKDTIRSKLNEIAKAPENVHHCILVEVFQPKAENSLLKTYLHPAVHHLRGPPTGPVLAFYSEIGNLVNFLKNFIFHAFKVGI